MPTFRLASTESPAPLGPYTPSLSGKAGVVILSLVSPLVVTSTKGLLGDTPIVRTAQVKSTAPMPPLLVGSPPMPSRPGQSAVPLTRDKFDELAIEWVRGVGPVSNTQEMISHPAYKTIVAYGSEATPFILQHLKHGPSLLAWALFDIVGINPVHPSESGNLKKVTKAWLKWGKKHHQC